ncbi:MAG: sialate O-acetylesterase, partial [Akkermansiaceae bacterium]|nr:sialate O-acetylesterase [Akkermansiaceae bacterium]MCF7734674.1 sialate O-acetylesterase [Akkermansiaceae bacterium]
MKHHLLNLIKQPQAAFPKNLNTSESMAMKPTVILTAALLCVLSPSSFAKPLKVFILAGQSNMQGHANTSTFDYIGKDPLTAPILAAMRDTQDKPRVCENVWISSLGCGG